ncbi:MAG: tetratricopeptide repeat protein [Candidatus Eisenbacteria bacterium]
MMTRHGSLGTALRVVVVLTLAAGLAVTGAARADDLKDGKNALEAGRLDDALRSYQKAADAGQAAGRSGMGLVYLRQRQLDKAMEQFQLAQKMDGTLAESYYGQGEVLHRRDQCTDAVPLFQKAVDLDRKFPQAQLAYGECLTVLKQFDKAIDVYSEGLKWGPKWSPLFLIGLGRVEAARDSLRDAGIYFTRAREQAPDDPQVRRALGNFYFERGTWALAINEFQAAIVIDTADAELHYDLAQAMFYDKRYTDALDEYQAAVRLAPDFPPGHLGLGNLLYLSGAADPKRYAEAREPLETYTKMQPDDPKGWSLLGRDYYYIKMKDEAVAAMTKAEQLGDKSKEMYTVLGRAYAEKKDWQHALDAFAKGDPGPKEQVIMAQVMVFQGQNERADSLYRAIIARDSTASEARFALNELGKLQFSRQDWEGALGSFQRRIALDPNSGEAYYYSGLALKQLKREPEAITALQRAAALDSTKADRWFWLGLVLDSQKQTSDARAAFLRSVAIDSTSKLSAKAYAQLGYYSLLDKDWSSAAQYLERSVQNDPQDKQSLIWLGQAYQNAGNRPKAIEAYKRVLAIDPAQPDALKGMKAVSGAAPAGAKGGGQ